MNNLNAPSLQHMRLVSGYVNGENNAAVGVPLASPSGSIVQEYLGMLGGEMILDDDNAAKLSLTTTGTLYGGRYKMVQLDSGALLATRGKIVFWKLDEDYNLFIVTTDETYKDFPAGILLNTITPGNYGFIQCAGRASVKFRAVLTAAGAIGSPVWEAAQGAGADNASADVLPSADPVSNAQQPLYLGVAVEAPTNDGIKLVDLAPFSARQ